MCTGWCYINRMENFKIIKGITHCLYTTEEFKDVYPEYNNITNWRSGKEGEWVLTDDNHVVQILKRGQIKGGQYYVRTVCGSYVTSASKKMSGHIAENIYTFSGTNEYRKFMSKKGATSREVLFARYVASGKDVIESYTQAFKTDNPEYAKQRSGKLLKTERVQTMIKEEVAKVLEDEGVTPNYIVQRFKQICDLAERDTDVLRSLESLAKISGMFAVEQDKNQQLTVWGGFSPEQLKSVEGEQVLLHGEVEGKDEK